MSRYGKHHKPLKHHRTNSAFIESMIHNTDAQMEKMLKSIENLARVTT